MTLSEQMLRAAALAAWENAASYSAEAKLLADHGYGARAVALAILGTEEFGKAIGFTAAALAGTPDRALVGRLGHLSVHEVKQLVGQAAEYAQIVTEEYSNIMASETDYYPSPEQWLADLFSEITKRGLADLLDKKEARKYFKTVRCETLRRMPPSFLDDPDLLLDPDRKNAALYVDLTPDGILREPSRIAGEAASQVLGLDWYFEQYASLPAVLKDDAAWTRFAARVRVTDAPR